MTTHSTQKTVMKVRGDRAVHAIQSASMMHSKGSFFIAPFWWQFSSALTHFQERNDHGGGTQEQGAHNKHIAEERSLAYILSHTRNNYFRSLLTVVVSFPFHISTCSDP